MDETYRQIRARARELLDEMPQPVFYEKEREALSRSVGLFESNPRVLSLIGHLESTLDEDFGHGFFHAQKVAIEAGAIALLESSDRCDSMDHLIFKAHVSGLLHDTMRIHPDHAEMGATYAETLLPDFGFTALETAEIAYAIRLHEAFKSCTAAPPKSPDAPILTAALYDADKFRWGPDNFSHTVWDMVSYADIPLPVFMTHYPRALEGIEKIKQTFRSDTGKTYGPGFIDIGLAVGKKLHQMILDEFSGTHLA